MPWIGSQIFITKVTCSQFMYDHFTSSNNYDQGVYFVLDTSLTRKFDYHIKIFNPYDASWRS